MEIKISTRQILTILYIVSWIIFIGLSIEAGGFLVNVIFTLALSPGDAKHLWQLVDLSALYQHDHGHYIVQMTLISIVAMLKATLFYRIIKILHDNKLNMSQPFSPEMGRFIIFISYLALGIGLFCIWGINYGKWLLNQGIKMPAIEDMRLSGADVWLFMGVTLFIIAQMFKRGIEIQSENDLTI